MKRLLGTIVLAVQGVACTALVGLTPVPEADEGGVSGDTDAGGNVETEIDGDTNMSTSSGSGTTADFGSDSGSSTGSSGSSTTAGSSSSSSTSSSADDSGAPPSFAADIYPTIQAYCVGCHHTSGDRLSDGGILFDAGAGVVLGHLDMGTVDAAYANLVNVDAMGTGAASVGEGGASVGVLACDTLDAATAGHVRVLPGQAAQSLLCLKLGGWLDGQAPPPCGNPMPLTGPIPDGGQSAAFVAVEEWVNGGALP